MLYKSADPKNCSNCRTIVLISDASKILPIVILNRMKNKVESEVSDCQAGSRSGSSIHCDKFPFCMLVFQLT